MVSMSNSVLTANCLHKECEALLLRFRCLEASVCKATRDCCKHSTHRPGVSYVDCIQQSSETGLLGPCGPNHPCILCGDKPSSHIGLYIGPKIWWLSPVVWGVFSWFFLSLNSFLYSVFGCQCLLIVIPTIVFWKQFIYFLSQVPHIWRLTQVYDSDYICNGLWT
jgi:hypothetical protein